MEHVPSILHILKNVIFAEVNNWQQEEALMNVINKIST